VEAQLLWTPTNLVAHHLMTHRRHHPKCEQWSNPKHRRMHKILLCRQKSKGSGRKCKSKLNRHRLPKRFKID